MVWSVHIIGREGGLSFSGGGSGDAVQEDRDDLKRALIVNCRVLSKVWYLAYFIPLSREHPLDLGRIVYRCVVRLLPPGLVVLLVSGSGGGWDWSGKCVYVKSMDDIFG